MPGAIDDFRHIVEAACIDGLTDLAIAQKLNEAGCDIGRERVRTWIQEEVAAGRLAPRLRRSHRGRRKRSTNVSSTPKETVPPAVSSLELLAVNGSFSDAPKLVKLFMTKANACDRDFHRAFRVLEIPQTDEDEIDFTWYARKLGPEIVRKMGELEFFLLAILQPTLRLNAGLGTQEWIRAAAHEALEIHRIMLKAIVSSATP